MFQLIKFFNPLVNASSYLQCKFHCLLQYIWRYLLSNTVCYGGGFSSCQIN